MRIRSAFVSVLFLAPVLAAAGCSSGAGQSGENVGASAASGGLDVASRKWSVAVCPETPDVGSARCLAHVVTDGNGTVLSATTPQGLGPADLASAYKLPSSGGSGATIAIVDAQDDPNAESDLAVYRAQYGLPACTTANGCFKKVNQSGVQGSYPTGAPDGAVEISLDLDMASAICPSCKIILVEANSSNMGDLGASVNEAAALGATVISNSYGGAEDSTTATESSESSTTRASSSPRARATTATVRASRRPRSTSRRSAGRRSRRRQVLRAAGRKPRGPTRGAGAARISGSPRGRPTPGARTAWKR